MRLRVLLVGITACSTESTARSDTSAPIVGTWRAESYVARRSDEPPRYPLGSTPRAYLVYDATGHVFFQAAVEPQVLDDARGRWREADSTSLATLLRAGLAYFGTYSVDRVSRRVTHRIEGEFPPSSGTTEVATPYRVVGDTLVLGVDSLTHWRFQRVR
jgi:hypothetical protein